MPTFSFVSGTERRAAGFLVWLLRATPSAGHEVNLYQPICSTDTPGAASLVKASGLRP
jgi:hypothetical protein